MNRLVLVPAAVTAALVAGSVLGPQSASAAQPPGSPYPNCKPGQSVAFSPLQVSPGVVHASKRVFPFISQDITPCLSRPMKIKVSFVVRMPKTCKPKWQPYSPMRLTLTPHEGTGYTKNAVLLEGTICTGRYTVHVPITSNGKLLSDAHGSFTVVK